MAEPTASDHASDGYFDDEFIDDSELELGDVRREVHETPSTAPRTSGVDLAADADATAEEFGGLSRWRIAVQRFFFPRSYRKAMRRIQPSFQMLDKPTDWFEHLSLFVIGLNMLALASYDPTDVGNTKPLSRFLVVADYLFIFFFTVELVVRLVAFGVIEFMRQKWNVLDAFIVVTGLLSIGLETADLEGLGGMRAMRVLRPLRTVTKFPAVKLVVAAMLRSLKDLVDVTLLYLIFIYSFSAAAMAQYRGRFRGRCVRSDFPQNQTQYLLTTGLLELNFTLHEFVCGGYVDRVMHNSSIGCSAEQLCDLSQSRYLKGYYCPFGYNCTEVENPFYGFVGFDNLAQAALTIQSVVTLELFRDVVYLAIDATDLTAAFFWTAVVVVGAFFIIGLLQALITVEFQRQQSTSTDRHAASGSPQRLVRVKTRFQIVAEAYFRFLHRQQQTHLRWEQRYSQDAISRRRSTPLLVQPLLASPELSESINEPISPHDEPSHSRMERLRAFVHVKVLRSKVFVWTTSGIILASIIIMATEYHGMPADVEAAYDKLTIAFTVFITGELLLRFVGTTPVLFLLDVGNAVGVVVVIVSWVDVALEEFRLPVVRSLRIVIAIKLLKPFPNVYKWFLIIAKAFRASVVLVFLMVLDIFIFACLGMQLFGGKFCGLDPNGVGGWCPDLPRQNFDSFGSALLTSFQLLTGDDWNIVMYSAMRAAGPGFAVLFVAHHAIAVYILVSLFIAIIVSAQHKVNLEMTSTSDSVVDRFVNSAVVASLMGLTSRFKSLTVGNSDALLPALEVVVTSRWYKGVVAAAALMNTVALGLTSPTDAPDMPRSFRIMVVNMTCSALFIADTLMAILAFGFVRSPRSYLRRTPWNILDFLVTIACIIDIILARLRVTSALRAVKIAFVLRPLRILKNSPGIRIVMRSMLTAIPAMKDVFIVALIFWTMFAIAGVQLFKGEFYRCSDPTFTLQANCTAGGARWVNPEFHFDNFGAAMVSLFVLSTLEGWLTITYDGIDAVRPGVAPVLNYNPPAAIFFVVFIIVGGFFLVQLFVSVLVNTYEEQKRQLQQRSMFLTPEQEEWLNCQKMVLSSVPLNEYLMIPVVEGAPSPSALHRFRVAALKFVLSLQFRRFVNFSIIANAISVGVDHYPISDGGARALFALNMLFTALFAVEAILKNVALTPRVYFLSNWNRFDFMVLVASMIGLAMEYTLQIKWSFATTLRTVRIMRIAVSPNNNRETLRRIVKRFVIALYALLNVATVVFIFIAFFALLCMVLFGRVRRDGVNITHTQNFETFPTSALMLFRAMSGENWPTMMSSCAVIPPDCDPNIGECGHPVASPIIFVLFVVVASYFLLSIFTAVIIDSFDTEEFDGTRVLSPNEAHELVALWLKFDPQRSLTIACGDIMPLLRGLPANHPLRFETHVGNRFTSFSELAFLNRMNLTAIHGRVDFFDFAMALSSTCLGAEFNDSMRSRLRKKFYKQFAFAFNRRRVDGPSVSVAEWFAARVVIDRYRVFKEKRAVREVVKAAERRDDEAFLARLLPTVAASRGGAQTRNLQDSDPTEAPQSEAMRALDAKLRELDLIYEERVAAGVRAAVSKLSPEVLRAANSGSATEKVYVPPPRGKSHARGLLTPENPEVRAARRSGVGSPGRIRPGVPASGSGGGSPGGEKLRPSDEEILSML